jgi:5-methylthioadenosine/S-adenosylhomocysteine deaminase
MQDILIKNTTVLIAPGEIVENQDILIQNGRIQAVAPIIESSHFTGTVIDGRARLFMPGLIDSHLHTGQQLLRGSVLDAKPIIWTRVMLPFESHLTEEKMKLSAEIAALEMITGGTTGFVESGSYHMMAAAEVFAKSGLRGALSTSTMDDPTLPAKISMSASEAIDQTNQLFDAFHQTGNLKVYYSLRALNACSDELIQLAAHAARSRNTFLEAHMNEYPAEVEGIKNRTGLHPYDFLEKLGVLGPHFLGAHSIFLTDHEKELIERHHVKICHCPFSNAGKGVPNTPNLLHHRISIGMGTDGAAHGGLSIWNEMKIFRSVMNLHHGVQHNIPNIMPAQQIFNIILNGGADALNETGQLGKIEPGYKADLISIDLNQPHLYPSGNWQNTLLESVNANDVTDMIVGGKILMRNREVLTLDRERIMHDARQFKA